MIKKLFKYGKIAVVLTLIMALTLPSYATVGASDGSAFVTKAEFDAALSDFNARLTTFEAGINSKIDSQVSSYLDRNGIWNGAEQTLEIAGVSDFSKYSQPKYKDYDYTSMLKKPWDLALGSGLVLIKDISKSGMLFWPFSFNKFRDGRKAISSTGYPVYVGQDGEGTPTSVVGGEPLAAVNRTIDQTWWTFEEQRNGSSHAVVQSEAWADVFVTKFEMIPDSSQYTITRYLNTIDKTLILFVSKGNRLVLKTFNEYKMGVYSDTFSTSIVRKDPVQTGGNASTQAHVIAFGTALVY